MEPLRSTVFHFSESSKHNFYSQLLLSFQKPGKFEYPELNGWMLVKVAEEMCENDFACAGFTFKGSYKTLNHEMEMYFFHIVLENEPKGRSESPTSFEKNFNVVPNGMIHITVFLLDPHELS